MKKTVNLKVIMMILISIMIVTIATTTVFAIDPDEIIGGNNTNNSANENVETITPEDYENAQNNTSNNTTNNTANNTTNNNTANEKLPQTGIEDTGIGVLLIICMGSAIFAYRKISDYRNI